MGLLPATTSLATGRGNGMWLLNMTIYTGNKMNLLNLLSSVEASSLSHLTSSGLKFAPQLAIQADTSDQLADCFISTNQPNPWFKLKFKSVTPIFNVRLGVSDQPNKNLPSDFNLTKMAGLSVYVSNSATYESEDATVCGDPWKYEFTRIIDFKCQRKMSGEYLHVIVPSATSTYLMICSIVLNRDDGRLDNC